QYVADLKQKKEKALPPPPPPQKEKEGGKKRETRTRMSKIRQVIARRLVEAQHTAAMLTTFNEIDMTHVMEIRSRYREQFEKAHGVRLGFMSFFVKGCVAALKAVPGINSYIDGSEIVHREYFDIGIAVGTEKGLMVPVLRNCDQLSFAQIEQAIKDFAGKARAGSISVDDLQGGGFTITNGGLYGSLLSTPILNPPQSGILGMHKIQERPVAFEGEVRLRPMMYTALSYDHRVVDGQEAVTFLVKLKQYLEDPATLMLGL
ncbi:MAG: dihydrolipoyllysine-residue succinyltransferase, partial [Verrucomicrobia bacterium]|nr:dihydrolipoyllysine-residue succinyltransferase [Verrucomicrobiota bacterium]